MNVTSRIASRGGSRQVSGAMPLFFVFFGGPRVVGLVCSAARPTRRRESIFFVVGVFLIFLVFVVCMHCMYFPPSSFHAWVEGG